MTFNFDLVLDSPYSTGKMRFVWHFFAIILIFLPPPSRPKKSILFASNPTMICGANFFVTVFISYKISYSIVFLAIQLIFLLLGRQRRNFGRKWLRGWSIYPAKSGIFVGFDGRPRNSRFQIRRPTTIIFSVSNCNQSQSKKPKNTNFLVPRKVLSKF